MASHISARDHGRAYECGHVRDHESEHESEHERVRDHESEHESERERVCDLDREPEREIHDKRDRLNAVFNITWVIVSSQNIFHSQL